jgi:hypothetical protein
MATIKELLNDQSKDQSTAAQTSAGTQPVATNDAGPDDPCCTPIGPDPGPDR